MNFDGIKKRLTALEPVEPVIVWPPRQGSFSYCIWERLGKPIEPKRTFDDFYKMVAEECYKRPKNEF